MEKKRKSVIYIVAAAVTGLLLCFFVFSGRNTNAPVTLNVTLYPLMPEYESFEDTVRESWKEIHPEVELCFVDWDCYSSEVPDDLDVFVFDTINLDLFAERGFLLPLSEEDVPDYEDLFPSFMEGCCVDGNIYAVPQFLCTDLLYTRKGDAEMEDVQSIGGLHSVLGDDGLLMDKSDAGDQVCVYLPPLFD